MNLSVINVPQHVTAVVIHTSQPRISGKLVFFGSDRTSVFLLKYVYNPAALLTLLKRVHIQSSSSSIDEFVFSVSFLAEAV